MNLRVNAGQTGRVPAGGIRSPVELLIDARGSRMASCALLIPSEGPDSPIDACSRGVPVSAHYSLYFCHYRSLERVWRNLHHHEFAPGATVEVNGAVAGTTPYKIDYPGGYFHKTHSVFGARLEHSITLRITKDGYLKEEVTVTSGPLRLDCREWPQ